MADKPTTTFKQLQAVEAVARLGSFTLAAKELGISQPSVSNFVVAMERQMGCKLLVRRGSDVQTTDLFDEIRPQLRALIALKTEIDQTLQDRSNLRSGSLWIGYSTYQLAMVTISSFIRQYPNITVTARALATHDLLPLLLTGALDVGYITEREIPDGLEGQTIAELKIGLILPSTHPLAEKVTARWEDVEGLDLIQREPNSGTRRLFDAAAKTVGCRTKTILGLGSWGSILTLVRQGAGIGVAFDRELTQETDLTFLPIEDPNLAARHYLVWLPSMEHTAAVRNFLKIAKASADQAASGRTS